MESKTKNLLSNFGEFLANKGYALKSFLMEDIPSEFMSLFSSFKRKVVASIGAVEGFLRGDNDDDSHRYFKLSDEDKSIEEQIASEESEAQEVSPTSWGGRFALSLFVMAVAVSVLMTGFLFWMLIPSFSPTLMIMAGLVAGVSMAFSVYHAAKYIERENNAWLAKQSLNIEQSASDDMLVEEETEPGPPVVDFGPVVVGGAASQPSAAASGLGVGNIAPDPNINVSVMPPAG